MQGYLLTHNGTATASHLSTNMNLHRNYRQSGGQGPESIFP